MLRSTHIENNDENKSKNTHTEKSEINEMK